MTEKNISQKIILVVEDNPILLGHLQRLFKSRGMEPITAIDGEQCLKLIAEHKPDFIILDILMPKINGIEVLEKIRQDQDLKNIPVLILTNFDLEEYRTKTHELGVVDFLVKMRISPDSVVKRVSDYFSSIQK